MNVNDQILEEIRERWKDQFKLLDYSEKTGEYKNLFVGSVPTKDVRYLLNRLDAAEKAARGLATQCGMLAIEIKRLKGEECEQIPASG